MCFFQRKNVNNLKNKFLIGYNYKGEKIIGNRDIVEKYDCGVCPECLAKKARLWSLRCGAEAQENTGVMVTLTYDTYKYNNSSLVENPVNPNLLCNVKHCQKFIKRLRKHFNDKKIKYLLCAEHGSRTNRAHYHAILFGVQFDDIVPLKRSKRGNLIYKSSTLEKIWSHGICTVDAINISGKIARYCTKYCAKDTRCDDTFMLFSRGIGDNWLIKNFNGKSYIIDGVEYPIPKLIWNKYTQAVVDSMDFDEVQEKYEYRGREYYLPTSYLLESYYRCNYLNQFQVSNYSFSYDSEYYKPTSKYRSYNWCVEKYGRVGRAIYFRCKALNQVFSQVKRDLLIYRRYLDYWKSKAELYELGKPSDLDRIRALPDDKYFAYKNKAIRAKVYYEQFGDCIVPRSRKSSLVKWKPICPLPLVNKGQMTPRAKRNIKTAFWREAIQDFVYLRPLKSY